MHAAPVAGRDQAAAVALPPTPPATRGSPSPRRKQSPSARGSPQGQPQWELADEPEAVVGIISKPFMQRHTREAAAVYNSPPPRRRPCTARYAANRLECSGDAPAAAQRAPDPAAARPQTASTTPVRRQQIKCVPATAAGIAMATAPGSPNPQLRERLIRVALRVAAAAEQPPPSPVSAPSERLLRPIASPATSRRQAERVQPPAKPLLLGSPPAEPEIGKRLYPGPPPPPRHCRYVTDACGHAVAGRWAAMLRSDCDSARPFPLAVSRRGMIDATLAAAAAALAAEALAVWESSCTTTYRTRPATGAGAQRPDHCERYHVRPMEKLKMWAGARQAANERGPPLLHRKPVTARRLAESIERLADQEVQRRTMLRKTLFNQYCGDSSSRTGKRRLSDGHQAALLDRLYSGWVADAEAEAQRVTRKHCHTGGRVPALPEHARREVFTRLYTVPTRG
eukprot:TRINITY_DN4635_c0_g3_i1.p1 TRINITY_DN4635_c0_g3~~TRINITY_DN4635_c0_g3_i1.p1  ORF type:complete len:488 (+),score=103.96 TRINITY_DN4635_c0_g3_i1:103-1464(+)